MITLSTASAVLRRSGLFDRLPADDYIVYCFGGIETHGHFYGFSFYTDYIVYCFGGIETFLGWCIRYLTKDLITLSTASAVLRHSGVNGEVFVTDDLHCLLLRRY